MTNLERRIFVKAKQILKVGLVIHNHWFIISIFIISTFMISILKEAESH